MSLDPPRLVNFNEKWSLKSNSRIIPCILTFHSDWSVWFECLWASYEVKLKVCVSICGFPRDEWWAFSNLTRTTMLRLTTIKLKCRFDDTSDSTSYRPVFSNRPVLSNRWYDRYILLFVKFPTYREEFSVAWETNRAIVFISLFSHLGFIHWF